MRRRDGAGHAPRTRRLYAFFRFRLWSGSSPVMERGQHGWSTGVPMEIVITIQDRIVLLTGALDCLRASCNALRHWAIARRGSPA